ncbi:type II secretion system protein [bacterium]|nr:type II secretion system protein [bacterium]
MTIFASKVNGGDVASHSRCFNGFTLAEVLITLGIIGVVAAMTLPTLIANFQRQIYLNQLKKNYAIVAQAMSLMRAEYDNIDPVQMPFVESYWGHKAVLNTNTFAEEFKKYAPVMWSKDNRGYYCFENTSDYNVKAMGGYSTSADPRDNGNSYSFILNNGACITVYRNGWEWNDTEHAPVSITIDVNGNNKNPNQYGLDIFRFVLKPDGRLLPWGYWLTDMDSDWSNGCRTDGRGLGLGCSTKIINNSWTFPSNYPKINK